MHELVLLVDDDEFARGFARTVLERAGFDVHEAEDVASALIAAHAVLPSAVVTDWNLPDGNGGDLARQLHQNAEHLPIILFTGGGAETEPLLDAQGACDFAAILYKPFPPSLLEKTVRAALERHLLPN